jgi:hypothetical protein
MSKLGFQIKSLFSKQEAAKKVVVDSKPIKTGTDKPGDQLLHQESRVFLTGLWRLDTFYIFLER